MIYLPPTSDFPPDPVALSRDDLNNIYLKLRNYYKSSMRSRGQHRSLANKAREETALLRQRLLDLAAREASVRTDVYEMLEIVTALAGDIEDAGDDLVNEFGRYKLGGKTFQGGSFLGGLMQAVIRFINRWTHAKERVVELDQKRQQFIDKTKDLPPFSAGSHRHQDPLNQPAEAGQHQTHPDQKPNDRTSTQASNKLNEQSVHSEEATEHGPDR